jgi:hypothetical protein
VESAEICRDHRKQCILKCCINNYDNYENLVRSDRDKLSGIDVQFNNIFSKHVKKKKKYEIDVISQV